MRFEFVREQSSRRSRLYGPLAKNGECVDFAIPFHVTTCQEATLIFGMYYITSL